MGQSLLRGNNIMLGKAVFCLCMIPALISARPQAPGPGSIAFQRPGDDSAYAGDNYFQYSNDPLKSSYGGPALINKREADQPRTPPPSPCAPYCLNLLYTLGEV